MSKIVKMFNIYVISKIKSLDLLFFLNERIIKFAIMWLWIKYKNITNLKKIKQRKDVT